MWTHPPFGGVVAEDGFIYGRGAMDIKCMLTAELEAVEQLLTDGSAASRSQRDIIAAEICPQAFALMWKW